VLGEVKSGEADREHAEKGERNSVTSAASSSSSLNGGLMSLFLTLEGRNAPETMEGVTVAAVDASHRVVVIANQGLEHPALCAEVSQHATRAGTEAMIIAPVVASSPLHKLTDGIGPELEVAQARVDDALNALRSNGIKASGHPSPGYPTNALLDGLRQFQASEVVLLSGREQRQRLAGVAYRRRPGGRLLARPVPAKSSASRNDRKFVMARLSSLSYERIAPMVARPSEGQRDRRRPDQGVLTGRQVARELRELRARVVRNA
jgi:hypothetical protein